MSYYDALPSMVRYEVLLHYMHTFGGFRNEAETALRNMTEEQVKLFIY